MSRPRTPADRHSSEHPSAERIQKALARQGVASRRQIENLILEGKLILNGKPARIGDPVSPGDVVMLEGKKIVIRDDQHRLPRVLAYNKPEGEICTRDDPEGRPTIFDNLPRIVHGRWVQVGRLDINTTGLILLTDDGELANKLMHPSSQVVREYMVRTKGQASESQLNQLVNKVELEDGPARFEEVTYVGGGEGVNHWYHVSILEGRNREVRRLWDAVGLQVSRLKRVAYGTVLLASSHRQGVARELTARDIIELGASVGLNYAPDSNEEKSARHARDKNTLKLSARKKTPFKPAGRATASTGGTNKNKTHPATRKIQHGQSATPPGGRQVRTNQGRTKRR